MSASAEQVKELRRLTGAGILECRKALEASGGDVEHAAAALRAKGLATAEQRADREAREGVLDLYSHGDGRVGVMVELNCETDFVARTQQFREFAHELALQIAANAPRWIDAASIPPQVLEHEREQARTLAQQEDKPANVVERIVEGRLEKFAQEHCLLSQPYIRDEARSVGDLLQDVVAATGEKVTVRRFVRWAVGEATE